LTAIVVVASAGDAVTFRAEIFLSSNIGFVAKRVVDGWELTATYRLKTCSFLQAIE
jgi:hypothetical protein